MTTQRNYEGSSKSSYGTADGGGGPYAKRGQTNFEGKGATRSTSAKAQMNYKGDYGVPGKTQKGSMFGEKGGTGCSNGY